MACEFRQCCRVCAQKNNTLIPLFEGEGLFRQLTLKLKYCLHITVLESDSLPTTICWKCVTKLEVCFELMQELMRGQDEFQRQILSQQKMPTNWNGNRQIKMEGQDPEQPSVAEQEEMQKHSKEHVINLSQNVTSTECHQHLKPCQCEECVSQYGSLPLLVEVIDKSEVHGGVSSSNPSYLSVEEASSSPGVNTEVKQDEVTEAVGPTRLSKRTISCEFCGKIFSHTGDLNKHRRKHTGERPYPCTQCSKRFSHTSNLLRHQKIHSGEMPYQCPTCARKFSRKDKMVNHIKNSHRGSTPETQTTHE